MEIKVRSFVSEPSYGWKGLTLLELMENFCQIILVLVHLGSEVLEIEVINVISIGQALFALVRAYC